MSLQVCCAVLTLAALAAGEPAPDAPRGLQPADFYNEVTPSEPAISPDGKLLAFTVMTNDEEANKRQRSIWMQRLDGGRPAGEAYQFTAPTTDASGPVWAPDGKTLGFVSTRGEKEDEKENKAWFLRTTAPGGEAFRIEGVEGAPVWSPDGKWIAFVKEPEDVEEVAEEEVIPPGEEFVPEEEREEREPPQGAAPTFDDDDEHDDDSGSSEREGWVAPDAVTNTLDQKRFDGRVITQMRYKRDGTSGLLPHRSARNKSQVYVVPAEGGEARQVTNVLFDVENPVWSDESDLLFFTGDPREDDEYNEELTTEIFVVARDGGEAGAITSNPGSDYAPAVSPERDQIAWLRVDDRGAPMDVFVARLNRDGTLASAPRNLTANWDLSPGKPQWSANGRTIRFEADISGNSHLFEVDADGGAVRPVTEGDRTLAGFAFARDADVMAYAVTDPMQPAEIAVARTNGRREQRVTTFNDEWLANVALVEPERFTWTVADGTDVEGWLMKPLDYDPSKQYPMILKIHGGPHGAYGNYWFRTFHVLSAAGFFVLYPNPRGSTGYGHEFTYATRGKWGEMDSEDYLTGVDAALAKYPQIDRKRVGVSGGSYGGFMTAWLSATTERFAAANPSRMIANWESWYGASDAQALTDWEFLGKPWEARETYRRLSPLNYVENVQAPTLIIQSEEDYRTPMPDAEQWFMALKKRNVPVELVRYPRSSHGLSRTGEPWLLVDRLERIRSWFVYWLIENVDENPAI